MMHCPTVEPTAGTSRHLASSVEVNFLHIGFQVETSHSHQLATAGTAAWSTNVMEPFAEQLESRPPNSAVEQSHRTRCSTSRMLGESESSFSEVPWASRAPSRQ
jgi:hypothetical protein